MSYNGALNNPHTMGRGSGWLDVELGHLAHSRIHESKDPIVGIEQNSQKYAFTMLNKFKTFAPHNCNGQYGSRNAK